VVVMDVNTGDELAMASYTLYDPNVLNPNNNHSLAGSGDIENVATDPYTPFLNRALPGQYPRGSIWKIVSMAAALESGVLSPHSLFTCTGVWEGLGSDPANIRYDWKEGGHGEVTFIQGLTASCNPYFYQVGLLTGELDFHIIPEIGRAFGFGETHNLILPEEAGLVPDPEWMLETRGESWTIADSVNIAIGQGDMLVTPLQIAMMVSAVANGGTLYRPQFVESIGLIGEAPSVTFDTEIIGQIPVSAEHLEAIRQGMRGVVIDMALGTAEGRLGSMQVAVAGKTGTAQTPAPGEPPHAWFAGFAPFDDPEIAVVVLIENSGQGSGVAAPIFRRIVERYYDTRVLDYPYEWSDPDEFEFVTDGTVTE